MHDLGSRRIHVKPVLPLDHFLGTSDAGPYRQPAETGALAQRAVSNAIVNDTRRIKERPDDSTQGSYALSNDCCLYISNCSEGSQW